MDEKLRGSRSPDDNAPRENTGDCQPSLGNLNIDLTERQMLAGSRPGDKYVRYEQPYHHVFRRVGPGHFVATPQVDRPTNELEKSFRTLKRILIGRPLETAAEIHERLSRFKALAVFGSDPISSCAYATEEAMLVLLVAGTGALGLAFYIALAVSLVLSVVAFCYRQTVFAYPHGGGSYTVSRENLGTVAGLVAASALLIDYVLTVSVSIVAGSDAVSSALIASGYGDQIAALNASLPHNFNFNVLLSVCFIAIMVWGNLRGIRESGGIFAFPTYLFIGGLLLTLGVGLFKSATGTLQAATPPPVLSAAEPLSLWLVLRAFSAGSVAMSGTEAISNGVPAFEKPEPKNAAATLTVMATLLGVFFLGVSFLATQMGLVPGVETVISQVARAVWGTNIVYYVFQVATMGILIVAGNTAFADFPRLASVLARDTFLPHQFAFRGDRLAFSTGILALGSIAAILVVIFAGEVSNLIHLYAVGVFLAFALSNSGMVVHWWKTRGANWKTSLVINGVGAVVTSGILVIVGVTKFALGAWIVIVLIPVVSAFFLFVHRHYAQVARQLRIVSEQLPPATIKHAVLVPIEDVNYASLRAIAYARTISEHMVVVHVSTSEERAEKIRQKMAAHAADAKLVIIDSPLRSFVRPLLAYVDAVHQQCSDAFITIVLPEFIPAHWWEGFLHNRTAAGLRRVFERHPNVAIVLVPYLLEN